MSSEDDDVVLQKHRGKLGTSLARPAVDKAVDDKASRRQSKESQSSKMSKIVSNSTQGRDVQPARKSATAALPDDDSDEDARMLEKHQHKLLARPKVSAKPQATEKPRGRPATLQAGQKDLERSSSTLSKQRTTTKADDSDSDPEPVGRSLLRARTGTVSQPGRPSNAMPAAVQAKPAKAASCDSDDELMHMARPKQSQMLSSKQAAQSTSASASKAGNRGLMPSSAQSRNQTAGTTLPAAMERRISRDSTASKPAAKGLLTQTSLQRSAAGGNGKLVNRLKGTAQVRLSAAKAADTSDADSDEEQWNKLSAGASRTKLQVQAVKAVKTVQAETSEDFSSADEWQTAKAVLRRASGEQSAQPASSGAGPAQPPSRRTTTERQHTNPSSALPARPSAGLVAAQQQKGRAGPASAPLAQPDTSHLARRSLLSRHVPPSREEGQQSAVAAAPAVTAASAMNSNIGMGHRLDAIPEIAEETSAQEVPQYLQQDLDLVSMAGAGQVDAAPAYAPQATSVTAAGADFALSQYQAAAAPSASSPRAAAHATCRHYQPTQSSSGRQHRAEEMTDKASASTLPAAALPEAASEGATQASMRLSLLQLAEADASKAQRPSASPRAAARQHESHHARRHQLSTAQHGTSSEGMLQHDVEVRDRPEVVQCDNNALQLQGLQASLVQTLTSTVESAVSHMRADMQQLDSKWSQWWQQSTGMCDNLQQQMGMLCSQQEATAQRLHQLETRMAEHKHSQQMPDSGRGGEGAEVGREDPRVSSVLERLSELEGRVGGQLDQLVHLQQQQTGGYIQDRWQDMDSAHQARPASSHNPADMGRLDSYSMQDRHRTAGQGVVATKLARSKSSSPTRRGKGAAGGGSNGDEHADWLVTLGEQLGGLQAQMQTTASTSSLQAVQHETAELRSALNARSAEATLYRKQYDGLCRKLNSLEEHQRQASAAARAKAHDCWWSLDTSPGSKRTEQSEQANAIAMDKRLSGLEARVNSVQQEASAGNSTSSSLQQRFAAMEWRVEQTASSCAATLRTITAKHERLAGTLAVVKEAANFAEAKCSALGSELARMHRQSARTSDMKV